MADKRHFLLLKATKLF